MTWDPWTYPATIRAEVHDYDELQSRLADATRDIEVRSILELGIGAGETAKRVLGMHPQAHLVGVDSSEEMLRGAAEALPHDRVTLVQQDLQAELPEGSFDLVTSALAIHHLIDDAKRGLFLRVAERLVPGGRFVMGDVVLPHDPTDGLIEIESGYDFPGRIDDQVRWMTEAGFATEVLWVCKDLALLRGDLPKG